MREAWLNKIFAILYYFIIGICRKNAWFYKHLQVILNMHDVLEIEYFMKKLIICSLVL